MTETLYELEGTWDELAEHAAELAGKRLRLLILPDNAEIAGEEMSIEEEILEMSARIPEEEWRRVPADLTDQLDHYIYGAPKR